MSSNTTLLPGNLNPPERWAKWASRLLVFLGIPLLLVGMGYLVGLHRGEQLAGRQPGAPAASAPSGSAAESAFAARFATAYLTYNESNPAQYRSRLQPYLAQGIDLGSLWDGQGTQQVTEALPASTARLGGGVDRVTVAVLLQNGSWLYLGVPVHASGGRFVVVAEPALLPAPGQASWTHSAPANQDAQLSAQLQGSLTAFFTAYAAGQQAQLGYYTTPGSDVGDLGGAVTLVHLDQLVVDRGGSTQREATAQVTWQPQGEQGTSLQESYRLTLVQQGGKWLVSSLTPAGGS